MHPNLVRSADAPTRFAQRKPNKEEAMKKVLPGIAIVAALSFAGSIVRAQDAANGDKTYKT